MSGIIGDNEDITNKVEYLNNMEFQIKSFINSNVTVSEKIHGITFYTDKMGGITFDILAGETELSVDEITGLFSIYFKMMAYYIDYTTTDTYCKFTFELYNWNDCIGYVGLGLRDDTKVVYITNTSGIEEYNIGKLINFRHGLTLLSFKTINGMTLDYEQLTDEISNGRLFRYADLSNDIIDMLILEHTRKAEKDELLPILFELLKDECYHDELLFKIKYEGFQNGKE